MAEMTPEEEKAIDAIGWFVNTPPDSEDEQLLEDVAGAIRQAEAAAREEERRKINKAAARLERMIVLKEAELWCSEQAESIGAVDGYDYRSGEEYAYRNAALYFGKAYCASSEQSDG